MGNHQAKCISCCHNASGITQRDEVVTDMKFREILEDKLNTEADKPRHYDLS